MSAKKTATDEITGYAEAVDELERILADLESDDVDVDHLSTQVKRAADLIEFCRGRLDEAKVEVTRIVADLDALEGYDDEEFDAEEFDEE
jgi:exodeoxyribonuclease VII small subunit